MKKKVLTILVLLLLPMMLFMGCKEKPIQKDTFEVIDYEVPSNLPEYALKLEWIGDDGSAISFNKNKPVMILFNGISEEGVKESLFLDEDIYFYSSIAGTNGVLAKNAQNMNLNLAFYWRKMGFNVGIFHYENFAFGSPSSLYEKFFNKEKMTYKNQDGEVVTTDLPSYTLTEAFVMEWLKLMEDNPLDGTVPPNRNMEVRFVGNAGGEGLALSTADYLYDLYQRGHIDGRFVPNRISLLNAHLDNKVINLPISYINGGKIKSILDYNASLVPNLSGKGIVFDMVESDKNHFLSYDSAYSGLVEVEEEQEDEGITKYELGDSGDSLLYKKIQEATAYLAFSESFSSSYPESYKALNRAVRDWYLYSVNGSDDTLLSSAANKGFEDTLPMLDDRYGYSNSFVHYSLSAWTPTSYIRGLKGVKFAMYSQTYDYTSGGGYIKTPKTMEKFEAENGQISDLEGVTLCGYVYIAKDMTTFVNYGVNSRLANVELRITINLDSTGNKTDFLRVFTGSDGFYQIKIEEKYYDKTMSVEVVLPSRNYVYHLTASDSTEYTKLSQSTLGSTGNSVSVNVAQGKSQILIRNCGLVEG